MLCFVVFCCVLLCVCCPRDDPVAWLHGVWQCGKALNERKAEIRIQFHKPPNMLFEGIHNNEIVMRIQPNEALWVKVRCRIRCCRISRLPCA